MANVVKIINKIDFDIVCRSYFNTKNYNTGSVESIKNGNLFCCALKLKITTRNT